MKRETRDILLYTPPFATWIALQSAWPATAWAYAVRTAATAVVGLLCWQLQRVRRPLPQCATGKMHVVPIGILVGVLVTVLWIVPEVSDFYRTWFCWPIGSLPTPSSDPSPYDPAVFGWALTIAKLIGSAFVIAPVEEVFFRSFLYRWLQQRDFLAVPLSRFDLSAFLWMVFLFTLEHDRPLAAAIAGALYGFTAIRFGLVSAIMAHVTTNLLLALHVIFSGAWAFW